MSSNIYDKQQKKLIPFAGNSEATAGSLDGLTDVNISSPTDGQVLTYDAANKVWINGDGATVIESLGDIADVDLTDLEDGQTIIWDAVEQKWIPGESGSDYLAGFGIDIDANNRVKTTDFVGTQAEWDALTTTEKEAYDFVHITDDTSPENYSPGHAISDGTSEKTQREVLEFNGFDVTDDSVNGKTKVTEVPYTAGRGVAITNKEVAVDETIATTFTGTQAEWNALTATEKAKYNLVNITDDAASGAQVVVDEVTDGNMNAVTSNAVANALISQSGTLDIDTENVTSGGASYFLFGKVLVVSFILVPSKNMATWARVASKSDLTLSGTANPIAAFCIFNADSTGMAQAVVTKTSITLNFAAKSTDLVGSSCRGQVVAILS